MLGPSRRLLSSSPSPGFWECPFLGPIRTGDAVVFTTTALLGWGAYYMQTTAPERDVGELRDLLKDGATTRACTSAMAVLTRGRTPPSTTFEVLMVLSGALSADGNHGGAARLLVRASEELGKLEQPEGPLGEAQRNLAAQLVAMRIQQEAAGGAVAASGEAAAVAATGASKIARASWEAAVALEPSIGQLDPARPGGTVELAATARALRRLALVVCASAGLTAAALGGAGPGEAARAVRMLQLSRAADDASGIPAVSPGPVGLQFVLGMSSALGGNAAFSALLPRVPRAGGLVPLDVWDADRTEATLRAALDAPGGATE